MTINWAKYNAVYNHPPTLIRGETKQLSESEILTINNSLDRIEELNKVISTIFDKARASFAKEIA